MKNGNLRDPNLDLLVLLDATARDALKVRGVELQQYDLSYVQVRLLYLLLKINKAVNVTDVSNMLSRKPHSISELLTGMAASGLIRKTKLPPGRTMKISITRKGRRLYSGVERKSLELLFSVLDEEERKHFDSCLMRIRTRAREMLGLDYIPPFLT